VLLLGFLSLCSVETKATLSRLVSAKVARMQIRQHQKHDFECVAKRAHPNALIGRPIRFRLPLCRFPAPSAASACVSSTLRSADVFVSYQSSSCHSHFLSLPLRSGAVDQLSFDRSSTGQEVCCTCGSKHRQTRLARRERLIASGVVVWCCCWRMVMITAAPTCWARPGWTDEAGTQPVRSQHPQTQQHSSQ